MNPHTPPIHVYSSPPQCLLGLNCYVDTIYLTIFATFLAILLSIWAGYREDRTKVAIAQDTNRRNEVFWQDEEAG